MTHFLRFLRSIFLVLVVVATPLLYSSTAFAQPAPWSKEVNRSNPDDLTIQLVTYGPGKMIAEYFGHTAIWVKDNALGYEQLYNFGMFQFSNALPVQFLTGNLIFWVGSENVEPTLQYYQQYDRNVQVDILNIPPDQRLRLAQELDRLILPQNREYVYDHYYDNCSTRVRDLIDQSTGGILHENSSQTLPYTLRDYTTTYIFTNPVVFFTLMFWMNDEIDQPITGWQAMFLPMELQRFVEATSYPNNTPLVLDTQTIYASTRGLPSSEHSHQLWPYFLLVSLVSLLFASLIALWLTGRYATLPRVLLGIFQMIPGLFFGTLGSILLLFPLTPHTVTYYNLNLLLANPITLILGFLGIGIIFNSKRAYIWSHQLWAVLAGSTVVCILAAFFFEQDISTPLATLAPINLGYTFIFFVLKMLDNSPLNDL